MLYIIERESDRYHGKCTDVNHSSTKPNKNNEQCRGADHQKAIYI